MAKYIQITTGAGDEIVPIGEGLFVERTSATAMRLYSTSSFSHHYELVTAINAAIEKACQTSWTNVVVPVELPTGQTVTSIAVTVFS